MVQLNLSKNSRVIEGKSWPKPAGACAIANDFQCIEPKARVY